MPLRILSIPLAPSLLDELLIHFRTIRQKHVGNGVDVFVLAEDLEGDFVSRDNIRGDVFGVETRRAGASGPGDERQ